MKNSSKSCDSCSYYIIDEDISNLSNQEQIEFEKFNTDTLVDISHEDLIKLSGLLQNIRRETCIGGLMKKNEKKKKCRYYKNLSNEFDKGQLLQSFIANSNKLFSRRSMFLTILLTLLTASLTLYGISQNNKNKELKKSALEYQNTINSNATHFKLLTDSIQNLNTLIKNQYNEQK